MPRVHSSCRQKNKPFKGKRKSSENKKLNDQKLKKTKPIVKCRNRRIKNPKFNHRKPNRQFQIEQRTDNNEYLDTVTKQQVRTRLKTCQQMRTILLLPCNASADTKQILKILYEYLSKDDNFTLNIYMNALQSSCGCLEIYPKKCTYIRNNMQIISGVRQIHHLLELCRCADIVCPVLSCAQTCTYRMSLDPYEQGKAFDDFGIIGVPPSVGIIQHLNQHQIKKHDKIGKLFKRFIQSEMGDNQNVIAIKNNLDLNKILRSIDQIGVKPQIWKKNRGYMLVQQVEQTHQQQKSMLTISGYLKGNCVNADQLIHLSGFEEYAINKIQIQRKEIHQKIKINKIMQIDESLKQYAINSDNMYPFSKQEDPLDGQTDILNAIDGLKINYEEEQEMQEQQQEEQFASQSQDQEDNFNIQEYFGNKEEQKTKRIELQFRKQDQLEFQDQVQYAAQEILRQKYKQYQGLKNFKTSKWNTLENLPLAYDRIYTFKNYSKTIKNVLKNNEAKGFAYPGLFIRITLQNFPVQKLQNHLKRYPLVASFLLQHERKMTMLHAKVRRNPHYVRNDTVIKSNQIYMVVMGFLKFYIKPIFSQCISGTNKTKYVRKIVQNYTNMFYCSFYGYNHFPPAPFFIYIVNPLNLEQIQTTPVMYGELVKCDPLHIILQRILITGYPYKINRRRSTVRFMFFNPKDVKFFKPIQLRTKMGLRGRIQQSLGTHGYMKCMFNDRIKHNDTVYMALYRRVYPQASF